MTKYKGGKKTTKTPLALVNECSRIDEGILKKGLYPNLNKRILSIDSRECVCITTFIKVVTLVKA